MINNRKGSSMVSVLIAFAVLMIGLSIFSTSIYSAVQTIQVANSLNKRSDAAFYEYYTNDPAGSSILNAGNKIYLEDEETKSFSLEGDAYQQETEELAVYYFK
ncbi:hypothetical protein M2454_000703 [Aequitasia blattaphilus]|uniref:Type 4 fimbrial biogenesis protein PilX N-terminal domain-containing protein n=1 Tax=Aequitasia blattaphilus TaxID=2949332 RepID=A0ABT1E7W1_9FIRM|nr:hypothetical protein [Aequitasia blattaphilus]MCP1101910.1 hypothetical protein [Aequitasia blattaphilus]MCR8614550.1 hypothetical protein [Aequitasia blattaphilus]